MKKLIIILPLLAAACVTSYTAIYDVKPYDEVSAAADSSTYAFAQDSVAEVKVIATNDGFALTVNNKNSKSIKVLWDECVYITSYNKSLRLIHGGIKYIDRNGAQVPTVIPASGYITDVLFPSDYIYYISGQYGGWRKLPVFNTVHEDSATAHSFMMQNSGGVSKLLVSLEANGSKHEYLLQFITAPSGIKKGI